MGRRGPKPSPGEKVILSTQVTEKTRAALQQAVARASRRARPGELKPTLSTEVNKRLQRSLREHQRIIDHFGGPKMYALLRYVYRAMKAAGETTHWFAHPEQRRLGDNPYVTPSLWLDDPHSFEEG